MGRRTLLVGLAAGLFFATSVAWLVGSAYAGQVEIKVSAEEEKPGCSAAAECPVTQLKIEVACPLPGGLASCIGAPGKRVGTVECEYLPAKGAQRHDIISVTLVGKTLQFNSTAGVEAQWAFGVVAEGQPFGDKQPNGQALKAFAGAGTGTACNVAGVPPPSYIFKGTDTIKSEITNKP